MLLQDIIIQGLNGRVVLDLTALMDNLHLINPDMQPGQQHDATEMLASVLKLLRAELPDHAFELSSMFETTVLVDSARSICGTSSVQEENSWYVQLDKSHGIAELFGHNGERAHVFLRELPTAMTGCPQHG